MKRKTVSDLGVSAFCESMAMMLRAGIQTDEALSLLLEENSSNGDLTEALRAAVTQVEEGKSASEALGSTGAFPDHMIRMIALGERSGKSESVFSHLAEYYEGQHTMSRQLKNLIRYPAVMLVIILVVLAVMLTKVLPVFSGVYESMTGSLSSSAYSYVDVAYILCWAAFILMAAAAVLFLLCLLLWRTKGGRNALNRMMEKLPLTSGIMGNLGLHRFFVAFRIALAAGEPQDLAMLESMEIVNCGSVEKKLKKCQDMMDEGHGVAQAAYHVKLLEPIYGRMLLAGSKSGDLDGVLGRMGALLRETAMGQVEKLVGLMDPILSGVMMVTVGVSLLSVMLPLIGMMSSIG